jgi:hypothetical protein
MQVAVTWELSAVPYIPALDLVAAGFEAAAASIHFRSVANHADFVRTRDLLAMAGSRGVVEEALAGLERLVQAESALARRLYALQTADGRIGFEASNQYYYVPLDLAEKVLNCDYLLTRWLPEQRPPVRPADIDSRLTVR